MKIDEHSDIVQGFAFNGNLKLKGVPMEVLTGAIIVFKLMGGRKMIFNS
jgi:hypothetical protein